MLVLLSPAKTLAFDRPRPQLAGHAPHFQQRANALAAGLRGLSAAKIAALMNASEKLAQLNWQRFQDFAAKPTEKNADHALAAFQGDVYQGLNAADLPDADWVWAHDHITMLSGLYGVLRPLDWLQPYRLEMSTKLAVDGHNNLYGFWGGAITARLNALVKAHKHQALIGCASAEYLKAVQVKDLSVPFIQCDFKEIKGGKPVIVALFAKRARGLLARYVVQNRLTQPDDLRAFNLGGYALDKKSSHATHFVFVRNAS